MEIQWTNPLSLVGYTAELGKKTGVKDFYMPYEYDGWSSVTGDNTGYIKGYITQLLLIMLNEYVADAARLFN